MHVLSPENRAYQGCLHDFANLELGETVNEVWVRLLRSPNHFLHLDLAVFQRLSLSPACTTPPLRPMRAESCGSLGLLIMHRAPNNPHFETHTASTRVLTSPHSDVGQTGVSAGACQRAPQKRGSGATKPILGERGTEDLASPPLDTDELRFVAFAEVGQRLLRA